MAKRLIILKRARTELSFINGKTHYYYLIEGRYVLGIIKITPRKFLMELVGRVNKKDKYSITIYDWDLAEVYNDEKELDRSYIPQTYRFKEVTLKEYNLVKKDYDKNSYAQYEGGSY
jgi:hypothetical protein